MEYRSGWENNTADTLSHLHTKDNDLDSQASHITPIDMEAKLVSAVRATRLEELQQAYAKDP